MSEFSNHEKAEEIERALPWDMNETIPLDDKEVPEEGYLYSINRDIEVEISDKDFSFGFMEENIRDFINKNIKILQQPGYFVGVWHHGNSHYIEAVRVTESEAEALAEAEKNGQMAIYDLKSKKVVYIKK